MKIEMGRVKCGDCFVISSGEEKLIVDCGSSNKLYGLKSGKFAYEELKHLVDDFKVDNLNLMISHFDKDHYNGVLEIPETDIFDKIYIPAYLYKNKKAIDSLGYFIALARNRSKAFKNSNSLVDLLINKVPYILKQNGKLVLVKANTDIHIGNDKFTSIWPDMGYLYKNLNIKDKLWKSILDMLLSLEIEFSEFNIEREEIDNLENFKTSDIKKVVDEFSNSFERYLSYLSEENNEEAFKEIEELNRIIANLNNINERINKFYIKVKVLTRKGDEFIIPISILEDYNYYHKNINNQYKNLIKDMNSSSIIMHKDNKVLFLGDSSQEVMKHLSNQNLIKKNYSVIKVQHHGTKKYFYKDMPKATFFLISNGGYKIRRIHEKFIDYADFICCSNGWQNSSYCEYYLNNNRCFTKCIKNFLYFDFTYNLEEPITYIGCRGIIKYKKKIITRLLTL